MQLVQSDGQAAPDATGWPDGAGPCPEDQQGDGQGSGGSGQDTAPRQPRPDTQL